MASWLYTTSWISRVGIILAAGSDELANMSKERCRCSDLSIQFPSQSLSWASRLGPTLTDLELRRSSKAISKSKLPAGVILESWHGWTFIATSKQVLVSRTAERLIISSTCVLSRWHQVQPIWVDTARFSRPTAKTLRLCSLSHISAYALVSNVSCQHRMQILCRKKQLSLSLLCVLKSISRS